MHDTHGNSIISYQSCKASGQFNNLKAYILFLLAAAPHTRVEMTAISGVKEGSLCAPLKELVKDGKIVELKNKINPDSNKPNTVYALPVGQGDLF